MEVTRVGPDGWRALRAARLRALADAPGAFLSTLADEEARADDAWRARAARTDAATFLAGASGAAGAAGMATGVRSAHVPGAVELVGMWTAPEHRRGGVGAALVEAVAAWAAAQGARLLLLDVATGNDAAARFYERVGFAPADDPALRAGMAAACDTRFVRLLS